jgi:hypothetical protein
MADREPVALLRQLGPVTIIVQRWRHVALDEHVTAVSSFGPVPIAPLGEGHAAVAIHDDESVWIGVQGSDARASALRVLARGDDLIDAVTGHLPMDSLDSQTQNYVVVPPQYAITGRATALGCARQFVRVASGPHQEAVAEILLAVHASIAESPAGATARRPGLRAVGPVLPRPRSAPGCLMAGHVPQVIQRDPFGAEAWDTTRPWSLRIEVLSGDEYQRLTGQVPPAPADRRAAYRGWRLP